MWYKITRKLHTAGNMLLEVCQREVLSKKKTAVTAITILL